jgi:hypothetical protein
VSLPTDFLGGSSGKKKKTTWNGISRGDPIWQLRAHEWYPGRHMTVEDYVEIRKHYGVRQGESGWLITSVDPLVWSNWLCTYIHIISWRFLD